MVPLIVWAALAQEKAPRHVIYQHGTGVSQAVAAAANDIERGGEGGDDDEPRAGKSVTAHAGLGMFEDCRIWGFCWEA